MADSARVQTGIPRFDLIMSGGFRQGQTMIVSGPIDGGKTTFGCSFFTLVQNDLS